MKINPNDPWYPTSEYQRAIAGCSGVTIRLKLAAMAMQGLIGRVDDPVWNTAISINTAFDIADAMIERANRDEGESE